MNELVSTIAYRRLRAPREDGRALFDPPLSDEATFLQQNIARREQADCELSGMRLGQLRIASRALLLQRAREYTSSYRDVAWEPLDSQAPFLLAGHQPELVHAGVWFKNFVLSQLARRTGSHAINLLIDNDSVRSVSLRVPGGSVSDPVVASVPFDRATDPIPYEERGVADLALFADTSRRVQQQIRPLVTHPLIAQLWPAATQSVRRQGNLGRALAEARHVLEGTWGLATWELPLSQVCDEWTFRWFAAHLMVHAERLCEVHNDSLAEYRRVNRVRSHTHPVPDLTRHAEWTEIPFWLWRTEVPVRRPAFVRRRGTQIVLSDRRDVSLTLDLAADRNVERGVQQLNEAHVAGLRLRPRALITTMYARLVLSDIFIHGIGGAKYDQLTDAIVRRFLGFEPPEYLVSTATLKLPLHRDPVDPEEVRRIDRLLRELQYHPERHVAATSTTRPLLAEKRRWIQSDITPHQRRERHQRLEHINRALHTLLGSRHQQLMEQRMQLRQVLRKQAILDSREYAFCLFPADSLRDRLLDLSRQEP